MAPPTVANAARLFNEIRNSFRCPEKEPLRTAPDITSARFVDHFLLVFSTYPRYVLTRVASMGD